MEHLRMLLKAADFAAVKHKDQRRKDPSKTPYINHPIGVAHILTNEGIVHISATSMVVDMDLLCSSTDILVKGGTCIDR